MCPRLVKRFGQPYVAGNSLADALQTVATLAEDDLLATLDIVGEGVSDENEAADAYVRTLDALRTHAPRAHVSLKPSGLGSDLSWRLCTEKIARIARHVEGWQRLSLFRSFSAGFVLPRQGSSISEDAKLARRV